MGSYFIRLIFQAVLRGFFSVTWEEGGGGEGKRDHRRGRRWLSAWRGGGMPNGAITAMSGLAVPCENGRHIA